MTARHVPAGPMPEAVVHASRRRLPGATRDQVFALAHGLLERVLRRGPLLCSSWSITLPAELAADLETCIAGVRRALASLTHARDPAADSQLGPSARLARALCEQGERLPDWLGLLGSLEHCLWVWDAPETMPHRAYDAIYRRDGFRCMAPGCTARQKLEVHHLRYQSQGGAEEDSNLLVLCRFHHQQGEHGVLAHCRGLAPLDVLWRLGHPTLASWWRNELRLAPQHARDSIPSTLAELEREVAAP